MGATCTTKKPGQGFRIPISGGVDIRSIDAFHPPSILTRRDPKPVVVAARQEHLGSLGKTFGEAVPVGTTQVRGRHAAVNHVGDLHRSLPCMRSNRMTR